MDYDLKIVGGFIVDGTGSPGYAGDIGIRDGKVVAMGQAPAGARTTIEARGRSLPPASSIYIRITMPSFCGTGICRSRRGTA